MDEDARREAFHSAVTTEHFVLQSAAGATISEGSSRSSLYLLSLSSSLVALGFALQADEDAFAPFAAAVLPTLFLLGWSTVVRLVDLSIENVVWLQRIARIRRYYATLVDEAPDFFPTSGNEVTDVEQVRGIRYGRASLLFTMASMIGVVNAVLGGVMVALLLAGVLDVPRGGAISAGVATAVVLVVGVVAYERRRFGAVFGTG